MGRTTPKQNRLESAQNARYKLWRSLLSTKGRKKERCCLVESRKLVADVFDARGEVLAVLLSEEHKEAWNAMLSYRRKAEETNPAEIVELPFPLFRQLSTMEHPDGILAVVRLPEESHTEDVGFRWLLLDHLQDPGNVGTLLRSAEVFGFTHIATLASADVFSPKCLRAAMGSTFRLTVTNIKEGAFSAWKKQLALPLYGADLQGESVHTCPWPAHFILAVGNEGNGISREVRKELDRPITIPMQGEGESLNAAVSGSVIMAMAQQRMAKTAETNPPTGRNK